MDEFAVGLVIGTESLLLGSEREELEAGFRVEAGGAEEGVEEAVGEVEGEVVESIVPSEDEETGDALD